MSVSSSTPSRASFEQVIKQAYYIHRETVKDFQSDISDWRLKCDKLTDENKSLVCKSENLLKALDDSKSENKSFIKVIDTLKTRSEGAVCQTCAHLQASMAAIQEAYTQSLREKDKMIKFLEERVVELTAPNKTLHSNPTARSGTVHLPVTSEKLSSPESDPDSITSRSDRCHRLRLQRSNAKKRWRYVEVNGHDNKRQKSSPTLLTGTKKCDNIIENQSGVSELTSPAVPANLTTDHRIFVPETMDVNDDTSFHEAGDNAIDHFVPETEMLDWSVCHNIDNDFNDLTKQKFNFEKKPDNVSKANPRTASALKVKNRTTKNGDMDCTLNTILNDMNGTIIDKVSQIFESTDDDYKTTPTEGKISFDDKILNVDGGKRPRPVVLLSPSICDNKSAKENITIKSPSLFDDDNCTTNVKKSVRCEKKTSKSGVKAPVKHLQKSSIDNLTNQDGDEEIGSQSPSLLHSKFDEGVQDKLVGTSFMKSQEDRREKIVDRKMTQINAKPANNLTNERATKTNVHRKLQKDCIDMTLNDSVEDLDVTIRRSMRQTTMSQSFTSPSHDRGRKCCQNKKRVDSEDKDLEKAIRVSLTEIQNSPEKMDQKRKLNSKSQHPLIPVMSENSPPFKKPDKPHRVIKHATQKARVEDRCVETAFDPDETLPPTTQSKIMSPKSENKSKPKRDSYDCRLITLDMNGSLDPDMRLSQYDAEDDIGNKQEEESQPITSSYKFGAGRRRKVQMSRQQNVDLDDKPDEIPEHPGVSLDCSFDRVPKKHGVKYAYLDVVRKQDDRKLLTGHKCQECWEYYEAAGLSEDEIGKRVQTCSRHRARFVPPGTPEHFWSIGFPDTEVCEERGYMNKDLTTKPSTFRRRKQLTKTFKTEKEEKMDPKSSLQKSDSIISDIEID